MGTRGFASDNNAPVHPDVLAAIEAANAGHAPAYGDDEWTARATALIEHHFGSGIEVFFVLTGTGANVLGLQAVTRPHHSIICPESAHIHQDECGAPERFTGCKVLACETADGKLRVDDVARHMHGIDFEHHSQPRAVSISQTTELGGVYSPDEVEALAAFAHDHGMVLQMDGARIANAAAALGTGLREFTRDAGVDLLSFGGTKNGMLAGEAVVFFDPALAEDFTYMRKQGMQLYSKMRYVAAQFEAMFDGDLWLRNAAHANAMAKRLGDGLAGIDGASITHPVEANGVFCVLPPERLAALRERFAFYVWDESTGVCRLMASWDTTEDDIDEFLAVARG